MSFEHSAFAGRAPTRQSRTAWFLSSCIASCALVGMTPFARAQTCAPAPQHALATSLPVLKSGDFWIYNVSGTMTAPASGATAAASRPLAGTIVQTVDMLPFQGSQTLAISTQQDLTVNSVSIYGTTPPPQQIIYLSQDPTTRQLMIVGDNAGPNGTVRVATRPVQFAPGSFSASTAARGRLKYLGGGSTELTLAVNGTQNVSTHIGDFESFSATSSATSSDGSGQFETLQWAPQLGAPVSFNSVATLPDGSVTSLDATLIESSYVPSLYPVITDGLNAPRGLAFGYGALWITDAGIGGPGPCLVFQGNTDCYGNTGRLSVMFGGNRYTAADGFGSLTPQPLNQASGPQGIAFRNGVPFVLVGGIGTSSDEAALGSDESQIGVLYGLDVKNGAVVKTALAHLNTYEYANVPDKSDPEAAGPGAAESNPYGLTSVGDNLYAADAAAHTVTQITPSGAISVLGVIPYQIVQAPGPTGALAPTFQDSVPTGIIPAPDGNGLLVADYTGYPYVKGTASVWRVVKGSTPTKYASGMTNLLGLAQGPNGSVYALQQYTSGGTSGDPSGSIVQISPGGAQHTLACQGLINPAGITTGPDGSIYVSNYGVNPGHGQVVRITPAVIASQTAQ